MSNEKRPPSESDLKMATDWLASRPASANLIPIITPMSLASFVASVREEHMGQESPERAREAERDKIIAWLDTLPWKGPGTPSIGDIMQLLKEGVHHDG